MTEIATIYNVGVCEFVYTERVRRELHVQQLVPSWTHCLNTVTMFGYVTYETKERSLP
jgi:hypothetical protein